MNLTRLICVGIILKKNMDHDFGEGEISREPRWFDYYISS